MRSTFDCAVNVNSFNLISIRFIYNARKCQTNQTKTLYVKFSYTFYNKHFSLFYKYFSSYLKKKRIAEIYSFFVFCLLVFMTTELRNVEKATVGNSVTIFILSLIHFYKIHLGSFFHYSKLAVRGVLCDRPRFYQVSFKYLSSVVQHYACS